MLLHPLTLLAAVASLTLLGAAPTHAQSPATNATAPAPTQDPRCSQHRSRDTCDASQPFSASSRCQWRFGACVRAAYCSPADCSGAPNPNCDQCPGFGNWCRSKPIGCPTACDRITVQADCQMWASANNGVPSCRWNAGRCAMVNPWAAAVQRAPAAPQPTQDTRAAVVPGGGNAAPETGPSTTGTNNINGGAASSESPAKGTTQATQKNEQYIANNPKLVPGILGGAAVVAVAGMVYIMRPNHPAAAGAGQSTSPMVVAPKPFNPTTRPPPPPLKKPAARTNNLHANRSPRVAPAPAPGLSPLAHNNNSLHPSSAAGARRGVVRKPSSLRMGVSADGTETKASPTSPRSAPGSPHISPLASPALTPGVVTTKTVDGKLTVSLSPSAAGGSVSPQASPRLSPMLSPTPGAVATRLADGRLTVSLAGTAPPPSPTFSALPSPTMTGPSAYYQSQRADFGNVPVPATPTSPASISTPPPTAGAPKRNHSIRSHVSMSPTADRDSFTPEMLAMHSQSQQQSQSYSSSAPASLAPSPASSLMLQALMDDLTAAAAQTNGSRVLVRQASPASSVVNAGGAPVRGTSAGVAKPSHF